MGSGVVLVSISKEVMRVEWWMVMTGVGGEWLMLLVGGGYGEDGGLYCECVEGGGLCLLSVFCKKLGPTVGNVTDFVVSSRKE
ncbi:hypothetical protein C5167_041490 [Papaver somniferum]|nr:hypothetical protein C5167_041490 [Papaver somniferum]